MLRDEVCGWGITPESSKHPLVKSFRGNPLNTEVNDAIAGVDKASVSLKPSGVVTCQTDSNFGRCLGDSRIDQGGTVLSSPPARFQVSGIDCFGFRVQTLLGFGYSLFRGSGADYFGFWVQAVSGIGNRQFLVSGTDSFGFRVDTVWGSGYRLS